jgi:hypothetical protein
MRSLVAAAGVLAAVLLALPAGGADAEGEFVVAVLGTAESSSYPEVEVHVSVVEQAGGRPVTVLDPTAVIVEDESGVLPIVSVEESVASEFEAKTAYVLAIDTGSNLLRDPSKIERAKQFALGLTERIGSNDVVKLVLFNSGVDESPTGWVAREDPTLRARLGSLVGADVPTNLDLAIRETAELSRSAPAGFDRRAVILVSPIDDESLTPPFGDDAIKELNVRFFTFSLGTPVPDSRLSVFYENLGTVSGGGHWSLEDIAGLEAATRRAFELSQRTWRIRFLAEGLPDAQEHVGNLTLQFGGGSGASSFSYRSGPLASVTRAVFENIAADERVSEDRDVRVSLEGKQWPRYRIELFQDCQPAQGCAPTAVSEGEALEHRLDMRDLDQGAHHLIAQVTVFDEAGREFKDASSVTTFDRRGTTYNLPVLFLVGGAAAIAMGGVGVAAIRKRQRRRPGLDLDTEPTASRL